MLVLSRKIKEQILIGDDVRITLLRIDGNKVRIGIDAPKHVRVIRGELSVFGEEEDAMQEEESGQITDREQAFAHPQPPAKRVRREPIAAVTPMLSRAVENSHDPKEGRNAPLAGYMTAS